MKLQLIGTRVAIAVDEEDRKTAAGLLIPENARPRFNVKTGIVVSTGRGTYTVGGTYVVPDVPIGARAIFPAQAGIEIEHEGKKLLVMEQEMLIGFTDPPPAMVLMHGKAGDA